MANSYYIINLYSRLRGGHHYFAKIAKVHLPFLSRVVVLTNLHNYLSKKTLNFLFGKIINHFDSTKSFATF